ncbi:hypothetical protein AVEN_55836-1 [Araneus ventricosus]|uniref:Uncharacterized protein n=1 Tax=Araneus ventricosus TaxID=182803 RepID=A0A4Y2CPB0_ARAVE|nr:hypothetical protein AVEN_55836-1 [Araneus ventricosus]
MIEWKMKMRQIMRRKKEKLSRQEGSFPLNTFYCGEKIQVCKSFYLGTFSISQKPVYIAHSTKNVETNTPTLDQRGKNENSRRVSKGDPVLVREHIKSFPVVESHYCRAHTKREYLGSHLSIWKIYELTIQQGCTEKITSVRKSMYYRIFVTEFNLGFHSSKSDRCDLCEKLKVVKKPQTLTNDIKYE